MKNRQVFVYFKIGIGALSFGLGLAIANPDCKRQLTAREEPQGQSSALPGSIKDLMNRHTQLMAERGLSQVWPLEKARSQVTEMVSTKMVEPQRAPIMLLRFAFGKYFDSFEYQFALARAVYKFTEGQINRPNEISQFVLKFQTLTFDHTQAEKFAKILTEEIKASVAKLSTVLVTKIDFNHYGLNANPDIVTMNIWRGNWEELFSDPSFAESLAIAPLLIQPDLLATKILKNNISPKLDENKPFLSGVKNFLKGLAPTRKTDVEPLAIENQTPVQSSSDEKTVDHPPARPLMDEPLYITLPDNHVAALEYYNQFIQKKYGAFPPAEKVVVDQDLKAWYSKQRVWAIMKTVDTLFINPQNLNAFDNPASQVRVCLDYLIRISNESLRNKMSLEELNETYAYTWRLRQGLMQKYNYFQSIRRSMDLPFSIETTRKADGFDRANRAVLREWLSKLNEIDMHLRR